MPFRTLRELTNVSQVKPGGVVTITFDPGPKYHAALLKLKDITLAQITEMRLKVNSEVVHRYSGTELDILNRLRGFQAYSGGAATTGFLRVPFDRPKLRQRVLEEDGGINTGQMDPNTGDMITVMKLEIQLASGAYSPEVVKASAFQSVGTNEGPGTIRRIMSTTRNAQGAGRITWSDFEVPSAKFMSVASIVMIPDANNITEVEVFRKQDSVFLADSDENDYLLNDGDGGRQAIAGVFPILWDLEGYGGNVLSIASVRNDGTLVALSQGDYRVKCQVDGAMQVTMLMEYLGRLK
ncbi:MAG: major capsid protein P2 [Marinobacter sp.]|nr:major capsid protein P2 [Marinobacter sp.]